MNGLWRFSFSAGSRPCVRDAPAKARIERLGAALVALEALLACGRVDLAGLRFGVELGETGAPGAEHAEHQEELHGPTTASASRLKSITRCAAFRMSCAVTAAISSG